MTNVWAELHPSDLGDQSTNVVTIPKLRGIMLLF